MATDEAGAGAARLVRLRTLATQVAKGKFTLILSTVAVLNLLRIVSSMVLTRLLDAEAFGVTGFILSVTFVFAMISDLGIFAFVVRHQDATDPGFLDEVWTIRLLRSILLAGCVAILASPIAHLLGKPELTLALVCSSTYFIGEGLASMAFATAVRRQQLGRLAWMDVAAAAIQLPVSIALAVWLKSYWALIFANMAGSALKAILSYQIFPGSVRRLRFSRARMSEMWTFSRYIAGSSIVTMVVTQSDKIALTRLMPLQMFGFYSIATTLAASPSALVSQYCNRVIYPYFSTLWREAPDLLREQYYARPRKVVLFYTLAVGAAIGLAPLIVEILYDHRYSQVGVYLSLLLISPCLAMNNTVADHAMVAMGRTNNVFRMNVVRLLWLICGGTLGYLTLGTLGIVIAVGTIEVGAMFYNWTALARTGLLRAGQEMLILTTGVAGYAIGSGTTMLAFHLLNMLKT